MLGAGDKLVALPLEALTAQPGGEYFVIDANKERLSQSSGFNDNDWPKLDAVQSNTIGLQPEASANQNRAATPKRR